MPMNFQCKQSHEYNDLLFYVFANQLTVAPHAADPEHNMRELLIMFIKENLEQVKTIVDLFLKKSLEAYIDFMATPSNLWRGKLALHLLAVMHQKHCIITKSKVFYSHPRAFPSPLAVHLTLVYLGNSVFRDTTIWLKSVQHYH